MNDTQLQKIIGHLAAVHKTVGGSPIDLRKFTGYAIASAVGYFAPLPKEQLDEPFERFFENTHMKDFKSAIGAFNELYPIDTTTTRALAKMIYHRRYKTVFEPCSDEGLDVLVDTIKYKMVDVGVGELEDIPCREVACALGEAVKGIVMIMGSNKD